MPRRILVAIDDSEASLQAADFVNRFFSDLPVEVFVVNVAPVPVPWYPEVGYGIVAPYTWPGPLVSSGRGEGDRAQDLVDEARERGQRVIEASGIEEDEAAVEIGDPAEVIRIAAEEHSVDLIVVGRSDKGWWARLLHGSVSEELARHAERPVLLVR